MSFYLLGRTRRTGDLSLITPETYDTRQAALEALSVLSAGQSFAYVDAEVFVADLDAAMPVLLVTPVTPPADTQAFEHETDAGVWEAPAPAEPAEEPGESVVPEEPVEFVASEAPPPYAESDAVLDEIIAVADAEPAFTGGMEPAAQIATSAAGDKVTSPPDALAGALKRATDALESEGIVAPESVGSSPAAWPWDLEGETYVPDPLEEPSVDGGDLLSPVAYETDVDRARPVIMGAYAEEDAAAPPDTTAAVAEPIVGELDSDDIPRTDSVLADLTIVTPGPVVDSDAGPLSDSGATAGELTCDDCVYMGTCPNKEDSEPASCGNFQWKSI